MFGCHVDMIDRVLCWKTNQLVIAGALFRIASISCLACQALDGTEGGMDGRTDGWKSWNVIFPANFNQIISILFATGIKWAIGFG